MGSEFQRISSLYHKSIVQREYSLIIYFLSLVLKLPDELASIIFKGKLYHILGPRCRILFDMNEVFLAHT